MLRTWQNSSLNRGMFRMHLAVCVKYTHLSRAMFRIHLCVKYTHLSGKYTRSLAYTRLYLIHTGMCIVKITLFIAYTYLCVWNRALCFLHWALRTALTHTHTHTHKHTNTHTHTHTHTHTRTRTHTHSHPWIQWSFSARFLFNACNNACNSMQLHLNASHSMQLHAFNPSNTCTLQTVSASSFIVSCSILQTLSSESSFSLQIISSKTKAHHFSPSNDEPTSSSSPSKQFHRPHLAPPSSSLITPPPSAKWQKRRRVRQKWYITHMTHIVPLSWQEWLNGTTLTM